MVSAAAVPALSRDFPDPKCFDLNGKPIFDAASHTHYSPQEKPMTDQELLKWKGFQLYKTVLRMERREAISEAMMKSDYASFRVSHRVMGSPFPVIEPSPQLDDVVLATRWYEHAISCAIGYGRYYYLRSAIQSAGKLVTFRGRAAGAGVTFLALETVVMNRSMSRLIGNSPNEHECVKFGVTETPERLREKAERWAKFAAYKKEWVKRWNYNVWSMRPGEEFSIFTACIIPYLPVRYNTRFDYPMRKNPFYMTATPIKDGTTLPTETISPRRELLGNYTMGNMADPHWVDPIAKSHPQQSARFVGGPG